MKTKGMKHQLEALSRSEGRAYYGLFMEQGTGKTWTLLAEAEREFLADRIDALLVVAPNGVHRNWTNREIPTHVSAPVFARAWVSGAGVRVQKDIERVLVPQDRRTLMVLAVNIDAVITKPAMKLIEAFCAKYRVMMVVDESSRIKNPSSARSKAVTLLRPKVVIRRIATGTPVTNSPIDVFSQMEFLCSGLLGTKSFRAFTATFADVLPPDHPMVVNLVRNNPRAAHAQMIARNADGSFRWRNLDKLKALLEPHTFRVLKRDCLDLPPKVYQTHSFELTAKQRKAYELMADECRVQLETDGQAVPSEALFDGEIDPNILTFKQQAVLMKLQQITSGFVKLQSGDVHYVEEENGRLAALAQIVEDLQGKFIVWARFKEELRSIKALLAAQGRNVVEYHGEIGREEREAAVDSFQHGTADVFLGQAQSGGIGLTLTAASTAIYFSKDFNLETRLQSEDRNHRIGTKESVLYIDIVAENTIDESITKGLRRKMNVAAAVLGDDASQTTPIITPQKGDL